jgi:hypothetical protein
MEVESWGEYVCYLVGQKNGCVWDGGRGFGTCKSIVDFKQANEEKV